MSVIVKCEFQFGISSRLEVREASAGRVELYNNRIPLAPTVRRPKNEQSLIIIGDDKTHTDTNLVLMVIYFFYWVVIIYVSQFLQFYSFCISFIITSNFGVEHCHYIKPNCRPWAKHILPP